MVTAIRFKLRIESFSFFDISTHVGVFPFGRNTEEVLCRWLLVRSDVFDGGGRGDGLMVIEGRGGVIVNIDIIPGDIVSTDVEIIDDIFFHGMFSESWRT